MKKLAFLVLFILSACTSALNPPLLPVNNLITSVKSNKITSSTFFPVDPDFVWQYDVVFHPEDDPYVDYKGTYTVTVDKVQKIANKTVLTLRGIDTLYGRYHFPEITMDKDNISIKGVNFFGFGARETENLKIDFIHLPLKVGNSWDDGGWSGKIKTVEKVSVPAGTYDEAWKIDVIGTNNQEYTAVGSYWIVPGVGIVKSELSVPGWQVESQLILAVKGKKKLF